MFTCYRVFIAASALFTCVSNSQTDCVEEIRRSYENLRFEKAHDQIITCLQTGQRDAHFELARMLLFELKWARRTFVNENSQTTSDRIALKREVPYQGIVRMSSGTYQRTLPYSREYRPPEFYVQVGAAWEQFDYLRLVVTELRGYLSSAAAQQLKEGKRASLWLKVLDRFAGRDNYRPYTSGLPSVELLVKRLGESVAVMKAIEEGKLKLE